MESNNLKLMDLDTGYCFLNDVGNGEYDYKTYSHESNQFNGLKYKDPDAFSSLLYKYHKLLWNKELPSGEILNIKSFGNYHLHCDGIGRLSSDFIGPSSAWAKRKGISNEDIGLYLKKTRTIGGHLIWPVIKATKNKTINQARGGSSGFYDRIDLTLIDLKKYYYNEDCKLKDEFDASKDWFKLFGTFENFIDFFLLQDFVDIEYKVLQFAPLVPVLPSEYNEFIYNNVGLWCQKSCPQSYD